MVSVALVATGVQWYWVNSTSSDIQTIADLGALGAVDAIAKVVTVVQVLDTVLLSLNVVALMLHAVVVVSGVAAVSGVAVGPGPGLLLQKAVEFDRKFCDARRDFARGAKSVADTLAQAAPYLAMGQATEIVAANSASLSSYNRTTYSGTAIPLPFVGEVTLSAFPDEEETLSRVESARSGNNADASRIDALMRELELARQACWEADIFRRAANLEAGWHPAEVISDYGDELADMVNTPPSVTLPLPATIESEWASARLEQAYVDGYAELGQRALSAWGGAVPSGDRLSLEARPLASSSILGGASSTTVYVVPHGEGERKAYHADARCDGLTAAAASPEPVSLSTLLGDASHPPCSLCLPLHWSALSVWSQQLAEFIPAWNRSVATLEAYRAIEREIEAVSEVMADRTGAELDAILADIDSYIRGGRLTYRPSGANGVLCVVVSNSTRSLPAFTMPRLTGANKRILGRQVALSGARLAVASGQSGTTDSLEGVLAEASPQKSAYLAGAINGALGLSDGLTADTNPLWKAAVSTVSGSTAIDGWFASLPWGLSTVAGRYARAVVDALGVGRPDLRPFIPALVNTYQLGNPAAPGPEGAIARALRSAKESYLSAGPSGVSALQDSLASAVPQVSWSGYSLASAVLSIKLTGKPLRMPYSSYNLQHVSNGVSWAWSTLPTALLR